MYFLEMLCHIGHLFVAKRSQPFNKVLGRKKVLIIFFELHWDVRLIESDFGDHVVMVDGFYDGFITGIGIAQSFLCQKANIAHVDDMLDVDITVKLWSKLGFSLLEDQAFLFKLNFLFRFLMVLVIGQMIWEVFELHMLVFRN